MGEIDHQQGDMFSYFSSEQRVWRYHAQRALRAMADEFLERMPLLFDATYAEGGLDL